jgi:Na+/H+-translocating membrane pyrophosphatase
MSASRAPADAGPSTATRAPDAAIRTGLAVGPILACVGIAWTAIAPSAFSSAAVLAGLVACFYATHRFGRLGADDGGVATAAGHPSRVSDAADAADAVAEAGAAVEAERLRKAREDARARAKRGE